MKDKYKIIINPPNLSEEQIAQHQDFDALLAQIQEPAPAPRANHRWLYYIGGAVAAGLLGFFFFQSSLVSPQKLDQQYFAEKPFIDPPFKNIKASYSEKSFNANQGGTFEYENGSRLIVPAAAFVDDDGQLVEGEVDIRYREYHDYLDFFLSGIPMQYDSAGTTYQLESAGMVEIYAEKDGKKVNVAPGKKIDVELVSEIMVPSSDRAKMPKFNVYKLDTEARNWAYEGVDNIEVLEDLDTPKITTDEEKVKLAFQEDLADLRQQELAAIKVIETSLPQLVAPVMPKRAEKNNGAAFSFDFNNTSDSQGGTDVEQNIQKMRKQYEGTMWQPVNRDYDQNAADNVNWEDMKLRALNNKDYELTLISADKEMKIIVNPVLMGEDFDKAIKEFNAQFETYEKEMAKLEADLAAQKSAERKKFEVLRAASQKKYENRVKDLRARGLDKEATVVMIRKKIINRFQATNFGIWNCDRPIPPFLVQVKGEFKDDSDQEFNGNTAFLVNKNRNTVCRFHTRKGAPVHFNSDSDNMMWLVTPGNKLALFRPEKFRKINQKKGDYTFVMNVIDKEINTEEDVRKILQF